MNKSEAGKLGAEKARSIQRTNHLNFVNNYYKKPKSCKCCNSVISFEKRVNDFCSRSCGARFNNVARGGRARKPVSVHACPACNKNTTNPIYCSAKCQQNHRHLIFVEAWLKGDEDGITCNGMSTSTHLKRWLREHCGDKCELCGWSQKNPVTNKTPLQLDHKDGNALNNHPTNIRLLCPNCHSLTPTFGSLNRGCGRKCRTELRRRQTAKQQQSKNNSTFLLVQRKE